ncbi:MAG: cytochrome c [Rhodospirillales bacterium]|jgi:cytochrome c556|nr:cytochrome c [Rhodospirillales bacterium]
MTGTFSKFVFLALLATFLAAPAMADEAAIKYRQAVMKALGGHMGSVAAIVKGKVPHSGHLADHGAAIAAIGNMTADLFPKESSMGKTGALPAIWEKPDDFAKAVGAFKDASQKFAMAAKGGDMGAVGAALGALGGSCGGCHKPFRQKK